VSFAQSYHGLKEAVVATFGQSHDLLHIHAGLAIYIIAQLIWGTRRGSLPAVGIVALFALFNEVLDQAFWGSWRIGDTRSDVVLTLFWPAVLMTVGKLRRWRWNAALGRRRESARLLRGSSASGLPQPVRY